jgi:hypothetical protein
LHHEEKIMKKLTNSVFILFAVLTFVACNSGQEGEEKVSTDLVNIPLTATGDVDTVNVPKFEFEEHTYDFGVISQGEKVSFTYKFKNVGKTNLVIASAKGSCGCTVPSYPKKPIPPGGSGVIDVEFNSDGKSGKQNKTITILANTFPGVTTLTMLGEISAPETAEN